MIYNWIKQHRQGHCVRTMCKLLNVSVSGFYDSLHHTPGPQANRRQDLAEQIVVIHKASRNTYGSPRVYEQLRESGEVVSEKTVAKIMKTREIKGKCPRRYKPMTTDSVHELPVADNLLARDFSSDEPNRKWVTDITYIDTDEGWMYLAVVLDLFSRRVVGWALADHMRASLVCEALTSALLQRQPNGDLLHHSDRGSQYASGEYQRILAANKITCSMSRAGNCHDNAVAESFFGTLKSELDEPLESHRAARLALFDYIEVFYNRQRLHSAIGYMSPAAYERKHQAA